MSSLLTVCTGNICRSPAAERMLAAHLGAHYQVSSGGTAAVVGAPIDPPIASMLQADGYHADGFVSRQLDRAMIERAHLILCLTRSHRSAVVDLVPGAVRRTFTLRELARILPHCDPAQMTVDELVRAAARAKPLAHRTAPADDDIVDPFRQAHETYSLAYAQVKQAVGVIVRYLSPGGGTA